MRDFKFGFVGPTSCERDMPLIPMARWVWMRLNRRLSTGLVAGVSLVGISQEYMGGCRKEVGLPVETGLIGKVGTERGIAWQLFV